MRIHPLMADSTFYRSNNYLVLGEMNNLKNVNTLIDAGGNEAFVDQLNEVYTGIGKKKVEQIIITHSHFDHVSALPRLNDLYSPQVYAFSPYFKDSTKLNNGQLIKAGDGYLEVLHINVHSQDSICLYSQSEKILFSGDTIMNVKNTNGSYHKSFVDFLERIMTLKLNAIYPGHGPMIIDNIEEMLQLTLNNVKNSTIFE